MLTDSPRSDEVLTADRGSGSSKILAVAIAVLISAVLLGGYFYLRNRHAQRNAPVAPVQTPSNQLKGPVRVHVLIDDPMLKRGETTIGGLVKNISRDELSLLAVELELRRRKDNEVERRTVPLVPPTLAPDQEGRYSIKLPAQQYGGVRLVGVKEGAAATLVAHTSAQGQRRPLEKLEPKTVIVQRPAPRGDEFINTPDNPGRVP
ncbi:MAG TPA: hypothetical protein VIB00_11805 [Pyrinomonadaceae bacterium]|jgi:hypothetical protein